MKVFLGLLEATILIAGLVALAGAIGKLAGYFSKYKDTK